MFRLAFVFVLVWLFSWNGPFLSAADDVERPNIVIITADNLGYGDVGCYGSKQILTPRLDRLAREGVLCTDFYTASPTCSASRAALLTGRYPQRNGLDNQLRTEENMGVGLRRSEVLLPAVLKDGGYATGCFGKWNIGFAPGSRPTERGFNRFFGHASGNMDYYTHVYAGRNDLFRGTEAADVEGYSTGLFADAACEFIREQSDGPFFVYLPFNAPHFPSARNKEPGEPVVWQVPDEYLEAYGLDGDETDPQKRYRAVVTALDAAIGRVLDRIDELELREKTLVVFYSDNGAFMLPDRGLEVASNAPLRDGGVTLYEGGIRVPCLVRWPNRIPAASVCREPLMSLDLFALACYVAGVELPQGVVIDGENPAAALAGDATTPHEALYFRFRTMSAVRAGPFKWLRIADDAKPQLFDLAADLGETTDVSAAHPKIARELERKFEHWASQFNE